MLLLKKQIKIFRLPTKNSWWILQLTGKKKNDPEKPNSLQNKKNNS